MAGFGLHDELQELVNDGISPFHALHMATVIPARYFRKSAEFGTVEVGKRADLLLLENNPLTDIRATRFIVGVMVRGRWLPSSELNKKIEDIPAAYQRELQQVERDLASDPKKAEQYLADHDPMGALGVAAVANLARTQGIPKFHEFVLRVRQADSDSRLVSEPGINALGYGFLGAKKYPEALALFRMNTEDFPKSANAYDSLGEGLFKSGDVSQARKSYSKALALDPKYPNADFAKKFIADHADDDPQSKSE